MQTVCGNPFFVDNVVAKTHHITEQFQKQKQKENTKNLKRLFSVSSLNFVAKFKLLTNFADCLGKQKIIWGLLGDWKKKTTCSFQVLEQMASSTLFVALKSLKIFCQVKSINLKIYFRLFEKNDYF